MTPRALATMAKSAWHRLFCLRQYAGVDLLSHDFKSARYEEIGQLNGRGSARGKHFPGRARLGTVAAQSRC